MEFDTNKHLQSGAEAPALARFEMRTTLSAQLARIHELSRQFCETTGLTVDEALALQQICDHEPDTNRIDDVSANAPREADAA